MTRTKTIETAFLSLLVTAFGALALLLVASPAAAAERHATMKERVAELCAVSDTDLVGKRLARECRKQVRAEAERLAQTRARQESKFAVR